MESRHVPFTPRGVGIGGLRDACLDAAALARLGRDLPGFLRNSVTSEDLLAHTRRMMASRDQRFLRYVERLVYQNPASPYLALLRSAGCEPGDLRDLVRVEGLEGALRTLADYGVYVTYDEFRGRKPIVRGSRRLDVRPEDFENRRVRPHVIRRTGGSSGRPRRVPFSLQAIEEIAMSNGLALLAHGLNQPRHVFWSPVPISQMIGTGRLGQPTIGWCYPSHPLPATARLGGRFLAVVGRLAGHRFPAPRHCGFDSAERLARWLARQATATRPVLLRTTPSAAARIGIAAGQAGLDLQNVWCAVVGESLTETRRHQIEAAGMQTIVIYGGVDVPGGGYACAAPRQADDVHLMLDRVALLERPRQLFDDGPSVNALLMTGLSESSPLVALNTESGDEARVEERDCACLLGRLGLRTHLSAIRSFEKLTGEGVTFARSDLQQFVERTLPERFGGTGLSYQAAEELAVDGAPRLILRVSPTVGPVDEAALREAVLTHLAAGGPSAAYHARMWDQASTIVIRREEPVITASGKTPVLHVQRRDRGAEST